MSASEVAEIRRLLSEGEIDAQEVRERFAELNEETDRDELWAKFAGQGLYDEPIRQDGYVSTRGNLRQKVDEDG